MPHRLLATSRWKHGAAAGGVLVMVGGALVGLRLTLGTPSAAHAASEPRASVHASPGPSEGIAAVGKKAFFDTSLSDPPGTSCASCHDPAHAFAGNNGSHTGVAAGSRPGHFARRNTPSVLYLKYVPRFHFHWEEDVDVPDGVGGFFWDGRVDSIASLVRQPLFNPNEMNARDSRQVGDKLRASAYADDLRRGFGTSVLDDPEAAVGALGSAIEAFLKSDAMSPFSSKYDDYTHHRAALTETEARGLVLFKDRAKGACDACHVLNDASPMPERSLFTDYGFEAVGAPRNRGIATNADPTSFDLGLCERHDHPHMSDERLCGTFRTPSLRNVAVRQSFMHNGAFSKLRDVVAFYATRGTDPKRWYGPGGAFDDLPSKYRTNVGASKPPYDRGPGETPRLDDGEIDAIVAFLETLTDAPYR
jgi:cytochrome c peroxidase